MAALKSDNEGLLHLDDAVDPKLGVWGILKESVRITLKHRRTILGVVLLFVVPLAALATFNEMRKVDDLIELNQLQVRCTQTSVASMAADQQSTSTPNIDPECLQQLDPLNVLRKVYGWGWFLELAATFVLAFFAFTTLVFAVVDAYDAERTRSTDWGLVEWLKLRLNRKLLAAALRAMGTNLLISVVTYGLLLLYAVVFALPALLLSWEARIWLLVFAAVAYLVVLVYLITSFYLATTVSVVEPGIWGAGALSRSSELMKCHKWKAFALLLIFSLLYWPTLQIAVVAPQGLVKPSIALAAFIWASKIGVYMFGTIVPTVFYLKCRAYWSGVKHDVEMGGKGYEHLDKLVVTEGLGEQALV